MTFKYIFNIYSVQRKSEILGGPWDILAGCYGEPFEKTKLFTGHKLMKSILLLAKSERLLPHLLKVISIDIEAKSQQLQKIERYSK